MSSGQSSDDEEDCGNRVDVYLNDSEVIHGCVVVHCGTTFKTLGPTPTVSVTLADTSVVAAPTGARYRCVRVSGDNSAQYHAVTAEQEETLIHDAAKNAGVKVAFTRWGQMVRAGAYPDDASPAERKLFGTCMLSERCIRSRADAKRQRDAESRRKRAKRHKPTAPDEPAPAATTPAPPCPAVEMVVRGTPTQVAKALRALADQT